MAIRKTYGIVPEGELTCVWMDAGVVDYKLCDRKYLCERCPFDAQIRQRLHASSLDQKPMEMSSTEHLKPHDGLTMSTYFEQKLSALLSPFSVTDFPADRMYSANHLWFKQLGPLSFRVGIDHLLLSLIESVSSVAFVRVPAHIKSHAPCAWIEHEGNTLPLKMPFTVTITNSNIRVREMPRLLKQHPYDNGWLLRLKPEAASSVTETLSTSSNAGNLYQVQAEEFRKDCRAVLLGKYPHVGTTLYDGGTPLETVEDIVGPSRYSELIAQRFLLL